MLHSLYNLAYFYQKHYQSIIALTVIINKFNNWNCWNWCHKLVLVRKLEMAIWPVLAQTTDIDWPVYLCAEIVPGSFNCLVLHRRGLFTGGLDGVIRRIEFKSPTKVSVVDNQKVNAPVTVMSIAPSYDQLSVGSHVVCWLIFVCAELLLYFCFMFV